MIFAVRWRKRSLTPMSRRRPGRWNDCSGGIGHHQENTSAMMLAPRRIPVVDALAKYMRVPMETGNSVPWNQSTPDRARALSLGPHRPLISHDKEWLRHGIRTTPHPPAHFAYKKFFSKKIAQRIAPGSTATGSQGSGC